MTVRRKVAEPSPLRAYFDYSRAKVNYLTHISRRHDAVFVEVPKAGCTVVKRVLQHSERHGEPDSGGSPHDRSLSPLGAPLRDDFDIHAVFGDPSPYFRFAFVRNPYSRALSCYLEKIVGEQWLRDKRLPKLGFEPDDVVTFQAFLQRVSEQEPRLMDIHWAPQAHLLGLDRVRYGFIGRFESFRQDLDTVVGVLGIDAPTDLLARVSAHTTNARSRLDQYYDSTTVGLVQRIYATDFDALGYGRDLRFA